METICTLLQTDNHTNTSSLDFFTGRMLMPNPNSVKALKVMHGLHVAAPSTVNFDNHMTKKRSNTSIG